jgi:hypothetical protein
LYLSISVQVVELITLREGLCEIFVVYVGLEIRVSLVGSGGLAVAGLTVDSVAAVLAAMVGVMVW